MLSSLITVAIRTIKKWPRGPGAGLYFVRLPLGRPANYNNENSHSSYPALLPATFCAGLLAVTTSGNGSRNMARQTLCHAALSANWSSAVAMAICLVGFASPAIAQEL